MTLFDEYKIKNITIKNRVVLPPMVRFSKVGEDGFVTEDLVQWYGEIAKGGVGLLIAEATCVSEDGKLRPNQVGIWDDKFIDGLKKIADKCHEFHVPVLLQIHHNGFGEKISEVSENILDNILDKFLEAIIRAKKSGFDGVEIHGAHTYLISQLNSRIWNTRTDKFGIKNNDRIFFVRELITMAKNFFDENFILGYRLGGNEPTLEDGIEIAIQLEKLGVDILHVSSGVPDPEIRHEEKIKMSIAFPLDWVVYMGVEIKKHVKIPVIGVRRIREEKDASWLIENNLLDFVAVGRAMISNPSWTLQARLDYERRTGRKL
ncbi:MAG: NADH:flavin oxidoreductase [Fusobacteriaceae bacterium]